MMFSCTLKVKILAFSLYYYYSLLLLLLIYTLKTKLQKRGLNIHCSPEFIDLKLIWNSVWPNNYSVIDLSTTWFLAVTLLQHSCLQCYILTSLANLNVSHREWSDSRTSSGRHETAAFCIHIRLFSCFSPITPLFVYFKVSQLSA